MAKRKRDANGNGNNVDAASLHDNQFSGGSAKALQPVAFDPSTVSPEMLNTMINSDVRKPSWKINKYPVPVEEFKRLQREAEEPDRVTAMARDAGDIAAADTD